MLSKRLDEKEEYQNGARDAHDSRASDVLLDNIQPLDGAENRLSGSENTISYDQGDTKNAACFQNEPSYSTPLNETSSALVSKSQLCGEDSLHLHGN